MLPVPASHSTGGSPSNTTTESSPPDERETTESTFSEIHVLFSPTGDIELKAAKFLMQGASDNSPLPNGTGDRGSDNERPSPTPIRTRPEPYYSNDGEIACL